ncbi:MAG: DUF4912 domain-containing protein [Candidatus Omnitrophica bacterium]|nr:DUF4912 domain-containing protein [Candidatus Omnitrophota bacterium]MBU4479664.1 DUF4912 domain-containing protein [Candidatus Omnitrophota bacterium]MCG2703656.1 DUF4912 domain-containing protein [Candidatus Omnitrophota bacterium]
MKEKKPLRNKKVKEEKPSAADADMKKNAPAPKKTLSPPAKGRQKAAGKKLGKGLEDISHLFLSSSKKRIARPKGLKKSSVKKTISVSAGKSAQKADVKLKPADVKKAASTEKSKRQTAVKNKIKGKRLIKRTEVNEMKAAKKTDAATKGISAAKKLFSKTSEKKVSLTEKKKYKLKPISELKSLFKKRALKTETQPLSEEQMVEESKFFVSTLPVEEQASRQVTEQLFADVPSGYGDNRITIQVRDPYWIHAYWEIAQEKINALRQECGDIINNARRILRIYDVTGVMFDGSNGNSFFDIEINDFANSWYLNVGTPGRSYCVDIGLVLPDGRFIVLARSNFVTTPIDGPSGVLDEEWMIVEDDFNRLYGLSAGLGIGLSSLDLRKQIKEKIRNISSGMISSPGAGRPIPSRNFWLVVNTELIVYGATEPGAQVTVQGRPITLNRDGTFSLRFALPEGEQVIPVKAVSPDKIEERVITPIVKKKTV